jgi:hypothetical protein
MLAALDALPERELVSDELVTDEGAVCAIGAVGRARGVDMTGIGPHTPYDVGDRFGIAEALASEIVYMNDERGPSNETPGLRWDRMRRWVASLIDGSETR